MTSTGSSGLLVKAPLFAVTIESAVLANEPFSVRVGMLPKLHSGETPGGR